MSDQAAMDISLVIPLFNEDESLRPLVTWIYKELESRDLSYQIVFVDDGSRDKSWSVIEELNDEFPDLIKALRFRRNYGKAAALSQGFKVAEGDVVITMDADLQDSPEEIVPLFNMITKEGYDLVSGWKKKRHDPISKTLPSKLFNAVARYFSEIKLHDFNCGLKAYRQDVVRDITVYGDMHRWMPVLAKWQGYGKIGEKVVEHRAREFGVSKFGAKRLVSGFLDLLSLFFVGKFNKKPMHFFGSFGILSLMIGLFSLGYLSIRKLFYDVSGISERPLFFMGILALIIGAQLFLTGFLAELIIDSRGRQYDYNISEQLNIGD